MRKVFFDTEFIEDSKTIDLVSIGLVADNHEYYAECAECDHTRAVPWVKENVIAKLRGGEWVKPRKQIAAEIVEFVGPKPMFLAYHADYDWVALCQLYGTMMDLPEGWPQWCFDIKQMAYSMGDPALPQQTSGEHVAIDDARWNRVAWKFLNNRARGATT
jgi:3' exoribonuclease, RNase T-like